MDKIEQQRRIARVIEEYDRQGWHRSGTEVDAASARWLADRVVDCGPEPTVESVPFDRFDPGPAYLQTGARRVAGIPLFDGGLTGPEGVSGSLGRPWLRLVHWRDRDGCRADSPLPRCAPRWRAT